MVARRRRELVRSAPFAGLEGGGGSPGRGPAGGYSIAGAGWMRQKWDR